MGSFELVKLLLDSVLSQLGSKFACFDIKNFYLEMPLNWHKYVWIKFMDILPTSFMDEYVLMAFDHNGWVKGVYSLKQAGKLANDLLT